MANNSFFGFLAGAAIGALAAAYLLSDKGKDDAERIKQAAGDLAEKAKNKAGDLADSAMEAVRSEKTPAIPPYLQDAHYKGAAELGRGQWYEYAHLFPNHFSKQQYLPDEYKGRTFYEPGDLGYEKHIKEWLAFIRGGKKDADV